MWNLDWNKSYEKETKYTHASAANLFNPQSAYLKGTAIQTEKALINDRLCV